MPRLVGDLELETISHVTILLADNGNIVRLVIIEFDWRETS
jgi:hypothetical protein